jgi:hypothetical protein
MQAQLGADAAQMFPRTAAPRAHLVQRYDLCLSGRRWTGGDVGNEDRLRGLPSDQ